MLLLKFLIKEQKIAKNAWSMVIRQSKGYGHWFVVIIFLIYITFQDNASRMQKLVDELNSHISHIVKGGGQKAIERHTSRGNYICSDSL